MKTETFSVHDPDASLVRQAQAGDYDAFSELVRRHEPRLWRIVLRMTGREEDAREALQNTMLAVIDHIESFRGDSKFSTWLVTVATREALRISKKRVKQFAREDDSQDVDETLSDVVPKNVSPWHVSPEELLGRKEVSTAIDNALNDIDPKYRQVFLLRDVEGLSIEETAQATGLTPANIKVRLMRARLMLRERLTPLFGGGSGG